MTAFATTKDAAMAYAAGGLTVFPLHRPDPDFPAYPCSCGKYQCKHPGKHPRTAHGKDDATTDPAKITHWWRIWPDANVAIRPMPGAVVIDIDPRNGGNDTMTRLRRELGPLPITLTARTGSGGAHVWLSCPGPVVGNLGDGIDVKTHSGYLVAPPSLHVSGGHYEWAVWEPVVPAPARWRAALLRNKPTAHTRTSDRSTTLTDRQTAGIVNRVANAANGERNNLLHWAACRMFEHGADTAALDALRDAGQACGLDRDEIDKTIASAERTIEAAA